ncbi:uncharacterized protein FIESC28_00856 [Fusarium coffeatum]|uniref:BZIP domain-containing protein n=1 Tax=Fusarium coffeatum TaxID=231269 RepID=A0A366SCH1_9HYPO|nr:uncharacterized protein FIESC28_00856 [Fusarium coffeatum]RBR26356.1 hypothetical protein FIESC28_00856 [Fusarium coffeatum]
MVVPEVKDQLTRRRERGRRSQAAFRKRQAQSAQALADEYIRLREGVQRLLEEVRGDERPEMVVIIQELAAAAELDFPTTLSQKASSQITEVSESTSDTAADMCYTSKLPDPYADLLLSTNLLPNCTTTQYRLDCSVWLDPLHYLRVSLPPQDILPYLGPGAESFGGLLFWSVMEHSQSGCVNHDTAIIKSSLGHSEATQDIKPSFVHTMVRARIEYRKTGSISQEHAVAAENDLGLVLCNLVEADYRSKGKDPNQWLSCVAIEKRIRKAVGYPGVSVLVRVANRQGTSALHSLLGEVLCKLYDSCVCFGDGPRWNVEVVDRLFAPLIMQALLA